jgi:hypothetical protein
MRRLIWAIKCFFLVLFAGRLPTDAVEACAPPELLAKGKKALPVPATAVAAPASASPERAPEKPPEKPPEKVSERVVERVVEKNVVEKGPDRRADGAVQALAVLQREGRLLDFLLEDLAGVTDDQIGAAVRDIQKGCRKALEDHFPVKPILGGREGEAVKIEAGFDPAAIRLIGNVAGAPPFSGILRHPGWKAERIDLPSVGADGEAAKVVSPAEVEV